MSVSVERLSAGLTDCFDCRHCGLTQSRDVLSVFGLASCTPLCVGFSVEARDVLLRMHIHTVQQLLAVDRIRFRYLRNVGDKIRREIRLKAKHLAEYRPDLHADGEDTSVPGRASLDRLGELLLPRRPAQSTFTKSPCPRSAIRVA